MQLKQTDSTVIVAETQVAAGEPVRLFLMSDLHLDSVHCERDVMFRHLRRAVEMGAWILIAGDLFDAMQGKFDPRRSMDDLREEYRREDYFDFVVEDVARLLAPFAERILLIGLGNHETSILRHNNTDLIERLVHTLRTDYNAPTLKGASAYAGWFVLRLMQGKSMACPPLRIRYAHGAGGGNAPVTRGVIQTNRQAVYLPDADLVWNGHNHQGYIVPIARERLSARGRVRVDTAWFVRTPGYKREFTGRRRGWAVERGGGPTPVGSIMVEVALNGNESRAERRIIEPTPWIV